MPGYQRDRKKLIQLIHVAKRELFMDDDSYRDALKSATGKTSCSSMGENDLEKVLFRFKQLGFKTKPTKKHSPTSRNKNANEKTIVDKIRAIWISMGREGFIRDSSEPALAAWVKRTTARLNKGNGIEHVNWLNSNATLAIKVLEQLKQWQDRCELARLQGENRE